MGQRKNDPHQKLESLERWSARATLLILAGIVIEIGIVFVFAKEVWERAGTIAADTLIGIGLIVEYIVIGRAIVTTGEANRQSEEAVANANKIAAQAIKEAAEARERTAEIEKLTAWRRLTPEQHRQIVDAIRDKAALLDVLIEFEGGDSEAFSYSAEIANIFRSSGVEKLRGGPNQYLNVAAFGLHMAVAPDIDASIIVDAFTKADIPLAIMTNKDLSTHFPRDVGAPNVYIFVAPKPPPDLLLWVGESNI